MDRARVVEIDRKHSVLKWSFWGPWEHKLHCSPLWHLKNYSAYTSPIKELSKSLMLKSDMWLWSSFVYSGSLITYPSVISWCALLTVEKALSVCVVYPFSFKFFFLQSQDVYSSYKDVPQENFAEVLLRTGKLAEAKTEGETLFPATEGEQKYNRRTHTHMHGW